MTAPIPLDADEMRGDARGDEVENVESLVPVPSSTDQSHEHSQPSLAEGSTSSFLLTLKPSKSRTQEPSVEDATTDEERRKQTPTKRLTEGEERQRLKTKASSTRKGHAPPPRPIQPVFTNLVLPHAKVSKAPTSGNRFPSPRLSKSSSPCRHVLFPPPFPGLPTAQSTSRTFRNDGRQSLVYHRRVRQVRLLARRGHVQHWYARSLALCAPVLMNQRHTCGAHFRRAGRRYLH